MRRGGKGSFFPQTPSEVPVNFLPFVFCCPQTKPRTCEFRSAAAKLCEFKTEDTMQKRSITLKLSFCGGDAAAYKQHQWTCFQLLLCKISILVFNRTVQIKKNIVYIQYGICSRTVQYHLRTGVQPAIRFKSPACATFPLLHLSAVGKT